MLYSIFNRRQSGLKYVFTFTFIVLNMYDDAKRLKNSFQLRQCFFKERQEPEFCDGKAEFWLEPEFWVNLSFAPNAQKTRKKRCFLKTAAVKKDAGV